MDAARRLRAVVVDARQGGRQLVRLRYRCREQPWARAGSRVDDLDGADLDRLDPVVMRDVDGEPSTCVADGGDHVGYHFGDDQPAERA